MRAGPAILLAAIATFAAGSGTAPAQEATTPAGEEAEDFAGLPEGPGREEVFYLCNACHSLMIVKQQRLSRRVWDETLDWMVEEQGMPELDEPERELVLDYLTAHYGVPDSE